MKLYLSITETAGGGGNEEIGLLLEDGEGRGTEEMEVVAGGWVAD